MSRSRQSKYWVGFLYNRLLLRCLAEPLTVEIQYGGDVVILAVGPCILPTLRASLNPGFSASELIRLGHGPVSPQQMRLFSHLVTIWNSFFHWMTLRPLQRYEIGSLAGQSVRRGILLETQFCKVLLANARCACSSAELNLQQLSPNGCWSFLAATRRRFLESVLEGK